MGFLRAVQRLSQLICLSGGAVLFRGTTCAHALLVFFRLFQGTSAPVGSTQRVVTAMTCSKGHEQDLNSQCCEYRVCALVSHGPAGCPNTGFPKLGVGSPSGLSNMKMGSIEKCLLNQHYVTFPWNPPISDA